MSDKDSIPLAARDGSPLASIPEPDEIRARLLQNLEENRLLRSLYRLSRQIVARQARPDTREASDE